MTTASNKCSLSVSRWPVCELLLVLAESPPCCRNAVVKLGVVGVRVWNLPSQILCEALETQNVKPVADDGDVSLKKGCE